MVKVLIVDDNEAVREAMAYIINKREGFCAECARDGLEALEKIASGKPDIIILDIFMPQMDGIETCKRIRSNPQTADIPVLFMSSCDYAAVKEELRALPGPPVFFLPKHCSHNSLILGLESLCPHS